MISKALNDRLYVSHVTANQDLVVTAVSSSQADAKAFWLLGKSDCNREVQRTRNSTMMMSTVRVLQNIVVGDSVFLQNNDRRLRADHTRAVGSPHAFIASASFNFDENSMFAVEVQRPGGALATGAPLRRGLGFRLRQVATNRLLRVNTDIVYQWGHREVVLDDFKGDTGELWVLDEGVFLGRNSHDEEGEE